MKLARRSFLKTSLSAAAVAGAATLPLFSRRARADDAIPKRLVVFYAGTGSLAGLWEPSGSGGRDFALGRGHAALAGYEADLTYFEDLDMVSSLVDPIGPANAHEAGKTHALTAANRASPHVSSAASMDQLVASTLNAAGPVSRLASLELHAGLDGGDGGTFDTPIYYGGGQEVPYTTDPRRAFQRAFGTAATDDVSRSRRRRLFSFLRDEHSALVGRLPRSSHDKLDRHAAELAALESRLGLVSPRELANRPDPALLAELGTAPLYELDEAVRYDLMARLNVQIAAAAIHCDVTRVASLQLEDPPDAVIGFTAWRDAVIASGRAVPDLPGDSHGLTHAVNGGLFRDDPDAMAVIERWHGYQIDRFRQLLDELATRTETDGSRLLDHCAVLFCSQIGDGSHSLQRLPWMVAGSAGGALKTGQWLRFGRDASDNGRSHGDLLLTLARAVGVDVPVVGNPDVTGGVIQEMLA